MALFGGDSNSSSTTIVQNPIADINPQQSLAGSGAGSLGVVISPVAQVSSDVNLTTNLASYYSPIAITAVSDVGDDALDAIQALVADQDQTITSTTAPQATTAQVTGSTIDQIASDFFSGDNIYYLIAAAILYFLTTGSSTK